MQMDSHIEVVSPDHYYAYSRHTERIFCNCESPCQTSINPMLATSLLHYNICYIVIILFGCCQQISCWGSEGVAPHGLWPCTVAHWRCAPPAPRSTSEPNPLQLCSTPSFEILKNTPQ